MEVSKIWEYICTNWQDLLVVWGISCSIVMLVFVFRYHSKQETEKLKQYTPGDTIHYKWGRSFEAGKVHRVTDTYIEVAHMKQIKIVYLENIIH